MYILFCVYPFLCTFAFTDRRKNITGGRECFKSDGKQTPDVTQISCIKNYFANFGWHYVKKVTTKRFILIDIL